MPTIEELQGTIVNKRCYESVNPVIRCPNAGLTQVTIISRDRGTDGRLKQVTAKGWGCRNHA